MSFKSKITVLFGVLLFAAMIFVYGGLGLSETTASATDVTLISSKEDMMDFSDRVNDGDNCFGVTFSLTQDIVLDVDFWSPIGFYEQAFHGTFLGNGHTVYVSINMLNGNAGLFGTIGTSGTVRDLTIKGTVRGPAALGSIAAENEGKIENCLNYASITSNAGLGMSASTGGIAGKNSSTGKIFSCVNFGDVDASYNAGGICGQSSGRLDSCVNFGTVTAHGGSVVGGVLGNDKGVIVDCYNAGDVATLGTVQKAGTIVGTSSMGIDVSTNYSINSSLLPACGGNASEAGKFEKKTLYDFLCDEGVSFSGKNFLRADYECGYGYLYAPTSLLTTTEGIRFTNAQVGEKFRRLLFDAGEGTAESPFEVADVKDWKLFGSNTKLFDYNGKFVKLTGDLAVENNISLGTQDIPFMGTFDGNECLVTIDDKGNKAHAGLFAYVQNAQLKDVTLSGTLDGGKNVGALVAHAMGTVTVVGAINYVKVSGDENIGGLIGVTESDSVVSLTECFVGENARVACRNAKKGGMVGGLIGLVQGDLSISDCYNYGAIRSESGGSKGVGGLIGGIQGTITENIRIENAANENDITASKSEAVGGLIGLASTTGGKVVLSSVANVANVTGRLCVGGLIGLAVETEVEYFAVIGNITGEMYVAGVAAADADISVKNGYFSGRIIETRGDLSSGSEFFNADTGICNTTSDPMDHVTENVYYNEDEESEVTSSAFEKKNVILLTEGDVFESEYMAEVAPGISGGVLPYPASIKRVLSNPQVLVIPYFAGTEDGYYLIEDEQTLRNFAFLCNMSDYQTLKYSLQSDITLTKPFLEISVFKGEWKGNGHKIYNLLLNDDDNDVGFFSTLDGATVSDLFLYGGTVYASSASARIGSIAGSINGTSAIKNCFSTLKLTVAANSGVITEWAGGIVGRNEGTVEECFFAGRIENAKNAGGIAGENTGTIKNCFLTGKITGEQRAGGVAAQTSGTITLCQVNGRVDGNGAGGGIAAIATEATITKCLVLADVQTAGNTGGLFETVGEATIGNLSECFFNSAYIPKLAYPGLALDQNENYAKEPSYFSMTGLGYFSLPEYDTLSTLYNDAFDAQYTRVLVAFKKYLPGGDKEDADIASYVKKSAELYIFDRNTASDLTPGSKNNPYLIQTAYQFRMLVPLTKLTDYRGKYFFVTQDINLGDSMLYREDAIGYYTATDGYAFCATMYGDPNHRPTISGVNVTRAEDRAGVTLREYLGVFANTEDGFVLRDLIFKGAVSAENSAGGLVGYTHGGVIERCLSYVNVTVTGNTAGGLVGAGSGKMTMRGCVVMGSVTAAGDDAYGLVGFSAGTSGVTVESTGSWFVTDGNAEETYSHNNYGSVLYDFSDSTKGQKIVVAQKADGFGFLTETGNAYKGYVMDFNNSWIANAFGSNENAYYPPIDDVAIMYCMRYCVDITTTPILSGTEASGATYASTTASNHYYVGERITAELSWTDDGRTVGYKFVGLKDAIGDLVPYTLEPSADSVIVTFSMTENTTEVKFLIEKISESEVISFNTTSGEEYDGAERTFTVNVENAITELFLADGTSASAIKDAHTYRVLVHVKAAGSENIIGTYETTYEVAKKTLTIGEAAAFTAYLTASYEKNESTRSYTISVQSDSLTFIGVADGEEIEVSFDVEYEKTNVGTGINVQLKDIVSESSNYRIVSDTKALGAVGAITQKELTLSMDCEEIDGEYVILKTYAGNRKPVFSGVYEIDVTWTFKQGGNEITSGFNVGDYECLPTATDAGDRANYVLTTDKRYVLRITPYEVQAVQMAVTTYDYARRSLKEDIIRSTYFTVPEIDSSSHAVKEMAFYKDQAMREVAEDVLHAGVYYCKATVAKDEYNNFSLASVSPIRVVVNKITLSAAKIRLEKDGETLTGDGTETIQTEDRLKIVFTDEDDVVTRGIEDEYLLRDVNTGSYFFRTEQDEENEKVWYVIPLEGTDTVTFRIEFGGATDYEDRTSEHTFTFSIAKMKLWVELHENEFYYGDSVLDDYSFDYYYMNEDGTKGALKDKSTIAGLEEANVSFGVSALVVGTYDVSYAGGSSNGYAFEFKTESITVKKKKIYIVVSEAVSKTYGEEDPDISYTVAIMNEEEMLVELEMLPDGSSVSLRGKLGRETGESHGTYKLQEGTLTKEANPNYDINYDKIKLVSFFIRKKDVSVSIKRDQGKYYGDEDGEYEWETVDDTAFVVNEKLSINDDASLLKKALIITREEGERVGYYEYIVTKVGSELDKLNYNVTVVPSDGNLYAISRVTPVLNFRVVGTPEFGENTNDIAYFYEARDLRGDLVTGQVDVYTLDELGEATYTFGMNSQRLYLRFTPEDSRNYSSATAWATIKVRKRNVHATIYLIIGKMPISETETEDLLTVANGASIPYTAKAMTKDSFTVRINDGDAIKGATFKYAVTVSGETKKVTEEGFVVTATVTSDYYEITDEIKAICYRSKVDVTVKLVDGSLNEGEKFTPTLSYSGFVGGEERTALTKQATVKDVPTTRGTYVVTPYGAESQNYTFTYVSGTISVIGTKAVANGVTVVGTISPEYKVTATALEKGQEAMSDMQSETDKGLGYGLLKPNPYSLEEYVAIRENIHEDKTKYEYTISFANWAATDVLCVRSANGSEMVKDFKATQQADGSYSVTFASESLVYGAARYAKKDLKSTILGYWFIAAIGGGALLFIVLCVLIGLLVKRIKRPKEYIVTKGSYRNYK